MKRQWRWDWRDIVLLGCNVQLEGYHTDWAVVSASSLTLRSISISLSIYVLFLVCFLFLYISAMIYHRMSKHRYIIRHYEQKSAYTYRLVDVSIRRRRCCIELNRDKYGKGYDKYISWQFHFVFTFLLQCLLLYNCSVHCCTFLDKTFSILVELFPQFALPCIQTLFSFPFSS